MTDLKSNMDRFIDAKEMIDDFINRNLKSNMDRFIAQKAKQSITSQAI